MKYIFQPRVWLGLNIENNEWSDIEPLKDYRESISYDPNGNILTYDRNGSPSIPGKEEKMDELTYIYYANKNQLRQVTDNPAFSGYYTEDFDNQANPDNYTYDAIGNLKTDYAEGIDNIEWTVYGKIGGITKDEDKNPATTTDKTSILYTYDASGNRISKTVTPSSGNAVTTVYVRDASGKVMSVYEKHGTEALTQAELHLYGSSRLGMATEKSVASQITLDGDFGTAKATVFTRGNKFFELSNHLGNVLATVSDKKLQHSTDNATVDYFEADIASARDYYPFGSLMPGRKWTRGKYRYGFNGKENDNEVSGEGNKLDFGARIYDSRIGKWLSVDPLQEFYPMMTPYQFVSNSPIGKIDVDGRWDVEVHAYKDRARYGYAILIVKNVDGEEVYRTTVRVQGMKHKENNNNPRNRKAKFGDTPTGTYKITGWSNRNSKINREIYGPNDLLETDYQSGEAAGLRNGMHVHGGRQEKYVKGKGWVKLRDASLWNTGGCMRIKDEDLKEIQKITKNLEENNPLEKAGVLVVSDDLQEVNGQFVLPGTSTSLFDNLYKLSPSDLKIFNTVVKELFDLYDKEKELKNKIDSLQKRLDVLNEKINQSNETDEANSGENNEKKE